MLASRDLRTERRPHAATPGEPVLDLRGVSMSFGAQRVVDRLSLSVARGEVVVLMGPSGAGKTTVLRIAAGLVTPERGAVDRHAGRMGVVFQEPRLLPWRQALDNVLFARCGRPRPEDRAAASRVARDRDARSRVLQMRRTFRRHARSLAAVALIAERRGAEHA